MKREPLISVIVPIYEVEKYLVRCLDSVINQSYKRLEIILVDDGSSDKCPEICDKYAEKDQRIVVIHKKNGGLSDARNAGIGIARGDFITFIDSDDYVDIDYVLHLYRTISGCNADIAICGYTVRYDNGKNILHCSEQSMVLDPEQTMEIILYDDGFDAAAWAKLYKKELFSNVRFPKGENFEDTSTIYKLVLKSKRIACDLKSRYNYMIRVNSIMTEPFSERKLLMIRSWDDMGAVVVCRYPRLKDAAIRGSSYARLSILRQMSVCRKNKREQLLEEKIRKDVLKNKKALMRNKRCPKRDKVALMLLSLGIKPFEMGWRLYSILTRRKPI